MIRKNLSLLVLAATCAMLSPASAEENIVVPPPAVNESLLVPPSILGSSDQATAGNQTTAPVEAKKEANAFDSKATSVNILQELEKRASSGDAKCQFNLGRMYALGDGISQDKHEALRWYRQSALQKYPPALAAMSIAYRDGHGVQKNPQYAAALMAEAARLDKQFEQASNTMQKGLGAQNPPKALSVDEILKQH